MRLVEAHEATTAPAPAPMVAVVRRVWAPAEVVVSEAAVVEEAVEEAGVANGTESP